MDQCSVASSLNDGEVEMFLMAEKPVEPSPLKSLATWSQIPLDSENQHCSDEPPENISENPKCFDEELENCECIDEGPYGDDVAEQYLPFNEQHLPMQREFPRELSQDILPPDSILTSRKDRDEFEGNLGELVYSLFSSNYYFNVVTSVGRCTDRWQLFTKRHWTIETSAATPYYRFNTRASMWKNFDRLCFSAKQWILNDPVDECPKCLDESNEGYLCPQHFAKWLTIQALCLKFDFPKRSVQVVKPYPSFLTCTVERYPVLPGIIVRGHGNLRHALMRPKPQGMEYLQMQLFNKERGDGRVGPGLLGCMFDKRNWLRVVNPGDISYKTIILLLCYNRTSVKTESLSEPPFEKHDWLIVECNETNVQRRVHDALINFDHCHH